MRRYILNPETLMYEIKKVSLKSKVFKVFCLVAGSLLIAFLYMWFVTSVLKVDLPKTAFLKAEHARLDARLQVAPNHFLSLMGNASFDFDGLNSIQQGRWLFGGGLGYGFNTIAGPLKAQIFWSTVTRKVGLYLSFGYNF